MKQKSKIFIGVLISLCLIYTALITSIEAVCYWTPNYFEQEYEKYHVLESLPDMTMSDEDGLMAVTHHMMKYLRGDKDAPKLQIEVQMGGQKRGFFTEREILHMEDVRNLFVGAQELRISALLLAAVLLFLLWALCRKNKAGNIHAGASHTGAILHAGAENSFEDEGKHIFGCSVAKGLLIGTGIFLVLCILLGIAVASDFTNAFITFHHIFFSNDLWILDPSVDMLVNIVPEGFFFDTASRILILFTGFLIVSCTAAALYLRRHAGRKM